MTAVWLAYIHARGIPVGAVTSYSSEEAGCER